MGLIRLLARWFGEEPTARPPPGNRPPGRDRDEGEEEGIAELIAIDII